MAESLPKAPGQQIPFVHFLTVASWVFASSLIAPLSLHSQIGDRQNLTFEDITKLSAPPASYRIAYGDDPSQYGELRLPSGKGPFPVAVVIHGGCWYSAYDLKQLASLSAALTGLGIATWNLEYRRIGNVGGGWPGTFQDLANGTDYLRVLAPTHHLDLERVITIGHSAGGELALWLAARSHLPKDSPLYSPNPLQLKGVVSLAGITNLRTYRPNCGDAVNKLLGGAPDEVQVRYQQTSPIELLPLRVPQRLIHGDRDEIVPLSQSSDYEAQAKTKHDDVKLTVIEGAGHFDLIAPGSSAWRAVETAVRSLLNLSNRSNGVRLRRSPKKHSQFLLTSGRVYQ